jgi:hypothetical protein
MVAFGAKQTCTVVATHVSFLRENEPLTSENAARPRRPIAIPEFADGFWITGRLGKSGARSRQPQQWLQSHSGRTGIERRGCVRAEFSRRYSHAKSALFFLACLPPGISRHGRRGDAYPLAASCACRYNDQASLAGGRTSGRTRPPLLETPIEVFDQSVFTPNDKFYVRWHWSNIPTSVDVNSFRLAVRGHVNQSLSLSLNDLMAFPRLGLVAINQEAEKQS